MRYSFGGDIAAWSYVITGGLLAPAAGVTVTFYDAQGGGSAITDLTSDAAGTVPIVSVLTSDGTDGNPPGTIGRFWGPDTVTLVWAAVGANPRVAMSANEKTLLLAGAQTITGPKVFGPIGDVATQRIQVFAEATGQTADLFAAWSGTDTGEGGGSQRTTYLDASGQLRVVCASHTSTAVRVKGQTGQTAHLLEQLNLSDVAVSWWDPDGSWRAPNLGHMITHTITGNVALGSGSTKRFYNDTGVALTIRAVRVAVGTAPTGAAILVDVNISGTTIFTTQANRPTVAIVGNTSGKVTNMNVTAFPDGSYLSFDIDQIGSSISGAELVAQVLCY